MDSDFIKGGTEFATSLTSWKGKEFTDDEKTAIIQYVKFNTQNKHKMEPIPTFKL
jgi:hypothetical protein